ncbi:hypothetical protein SAMN05421505_1608 [Sinosporangium album]|uniref:Threonine dehydrogenase n=1 Tax=Sinosporangium album TaxID=504805 RepID=A0A1G8L2M0_9ACTN|nr:hypothetical protein [Sinosporangium album]SDI49888.1 hypothetical protein SAMN05421505_1608 [Sinosporangium album]
MPALVPPAYAVPRVEFRDGQARLLPARPAPAGMVRARYSIVSPGTERRHLADSVTAPRMAGYMSLSGDVERGWLLAPVPHGAAWRPTPEMGVAAPPGTSLAAAALARFAQMALLGLDRLPPGTDLRQTVVVGSGPVALGCVLELYRRGCAAITVLTSRPDAPIGHAPGARCVAALPSGGARLVIDATGAPQRAIALLAPGAVLGLLGTPATGEAMPFAAVHRSCWTVVGMHELGSLSSEGYPAAYHTAVTWLRSLPAVLLESWCRILPGEHAEGAYRALARHRLPGPVTIFDWGS